MRELVYLSRRPGTPIIDNNALTGALRTLKLGGMLGPTSGAAGCASRATSCQRGSSPVAASRVEVDVGRVAGLLAAEAHSKGVAAVLAPMMNLQRSPLAGALGLSACRRTRFCPIGSARSWCVACSG